MFGLRYLFGYDQDKDVKQEMVILMNSELVPTLQERITQRTKDVDLLKKFREESARREARVRGN